MSILTICRLLLTKHPADLARFGKTLGLVFREYRPVIDDDVKYTLTFGEQRRRHTKIFLQLGSQTDRLGFVVSLRAVVYLDFHRCLCLVRQELVRQGLGR